MNRPLRTPCLLKKRSSQVNEILDLNQFSSTGKLLRSMAWVLRFIDNIKCKVNCKDANTKNQVSIDELERVENIMIRSIQQEAFRKEISYLQNNAPGLRKTRPPIYVNQLNLYIDEEGVLRCRTRIKNAQVRDSTKKPILLPPRNPYWELLIKCYERVFHNGVRETLNMLSRGGFRHSQRSRLRISDVPLLPISLIY